MSCEICAVTSTTTNTTTLVSDTNIEKLAEDTGLTAAAGYYIGVGLAIGVVLVSICAVCFFCGWCPPRTKEQFNGKGAARDPETQGGSMQVHPEQQSYSGYADEGYTYPGQQYPGQQPYATTPASTDVYADQQHYSGGNPHDLAPVNEDFIPTGDAPGQYHIMVDATAVGETRWLGDVIEELNYGDIVDVLEVVWNHEDQRIRGRIAQPAGWISLCCTDEGNHRRWAEKLEGNGPLSPSGTPHSPGLAAYSMQPGGVPTQPSMYPPPSPTATTQYGGFSTFSGQPQPQPMSPQQLSPHQGVSQHTSPHSQASARSGATPSMVPAQAPISMVPPPQQGHADPATPRQQGATPRSARSQPKTPRDMANVGSSNSYSNNNNTNQVPETPAGTVTTPSMLPQVQEHTQHAHGHESEYVTPLSPQGSIAPSMAGSHISSAVGSTYGNTVPGTNFAVGDQVISKVNFNGSTGSVAKGDIGEVVGEVKPDRRGNRKSDGRINCRFPNHPNVNLKTSQIQKVETNVDPVPAAV